MSEDDLLADLAELVAQFAYLSSARAELVARVDNFEDLVAESRIQRERLKRFQKELEQLLCDVTLMLESRQTYLRKVR